MPIQSIKKNMKKTKITKLERLAKYICIGNDKYSLLVHLGMSGNMLHIKESKPIYKHTHYILKLDDQGEKKFVHYVDPRRFGRLGFSSNENINSHPYLIKCGVEPLGKVNLAKHLFKQSRNKKKPLKNFLMDNQIVVGVGNIYASESLFLTGITPQKPAGAITHTEYSTLSKNIKATLRKAIKAGGTTLKDYQSLKGEPGYFRIHLNVYDRKNEPCFNCDTMIESIKIAGRSSFYCPKCQK
jgi:formamidopyrimidine-DNA glycosylase